MACTRLQDFYKTGKKIVAAATNYKEVLKVKNLPKPDKPVVFLKPTSSYVTEGNKIVIPEGFTVNHEIELGVIISRKCKNVCEEDAMDVVAGYCAALDMTAASELADARAKGLPWCVGKGFDTSCAVGKFIPKEAIPDPHNVDIWCNVNGTPRQKSNTKDFIFTIPQLIAYISQYMTLEPSDLILTGTPPGMAPIEENDIILGGIADVSSIKFCVASCNS